MIETMLVFLAALGLIWLAQFDGRKGWARPLTYLLLSALDLLVLLAALFIGLAPEAWHAFIPSPPPQHLPIMLLGIGLLLSIPLLWAIWNDVRGRTRYLGTLQLNHALTQTAWTLLVFFLGSNFILFTVKPLSEFTIEDPLHLLWVQNTAFTLIAMVGVGWGVRRSWPEVRTRLGLRAPRWRDLWIGFGMGLLMLITTALLGAVLILFFGEDLAASSAFNQQILEKLPGIAGILMMGALSGIGEEMLYRGALQPVLGLTLTSALFALSHIQYLSPSIVIIFVLGLMLGYARNKWGLSTAIWMHAVYNSLVGLLALLAAAPN